MRRDLNPVESWNGLIVDFYCGMMRISFLFSTLFLRILNTSFTFVMTTELIFFMELP